MSNHAEDLDENMIVSGRKGLVAIRSTNSLVARGLANLAQLRLCETSEAAPEATTDAIRHIARGVFNGLRKGNYDTAIVEITEGIRLDPKCWSAYHARGLAWLHKKVYEKAVDDFTEFFRRAPADDPDTYTSLAWLLATFPDEKFRDGKRAVQLATAACELINWEGCFELETLAAAFAETGQFDEAEQYQAKALGFAEAWNVDESRYRLGLYRHRQPLRVDGLCRLQERIQPKVQGASI